MTTDELITRAQHTLRTGQLNLAVLYMRKALEQTDQTRRELNPDGYAIRQLKNAFQSYGEAIVAVGNLIVDAYAQAFKPLMDLIATTANTTQNDYTLVGPGK